MFTSLKSQKFIRNPQIIVSSRQIFQRNPTKNFVLSTKTTEVGFEWLFKLLGEGGTDVMIPIFNALAFPYKSITDAVIASKDKLMEELKDADKKDVMLFILGNLVFRVPIGIGQAIVWILKWLGNSIAVGRTVRYRESPIITYNAIVTNKIPKTSKSPTFVIKDTGDLESIGSYIFDYEIEFTDVTNTVIKRVVERTTLDVDMYDFMKFAWKEFVDAGLLKIGKPIYHGLVFIGKSSIDLGKAGLAGIKAALAGIKKGLATALPTLAGLGTSLKTSICGPTTVVTKCDWNTCLQQVVDDKGTGHLRKLLLQALQRLDMNTTDEYKEFKEKLMKMLESNYSLYQVFQEELLKQLNRKYIPQVKLAEADFVEIINDEEHKKDLEEMRIVYDIYSDIPTKTME
jgi:hypothetical protein